MTMVAEISNEPVRRERPLFTIALAEVINTVDLTGNGRVQVQLPWLAATQPWARVAVPAAGSNRGMYVLPHEGDEVLAGLQSQRRRRTATSSGRSGTHRIRHRAAGRSTRPRRS